MISFPVTTSYSEISQSNPIRWAILHRDGDNYVAQSNWMRCKDFFNDYVVAYNGGKRFGIYGFNTETMTLPAKGKAVYMAVRHLNPQFEQNIAALNSGLPKPIKIRKVGEETVLQIPSYYFGNTYRISLISLIIRMCNVPQVFENFEQFKTASHIHPQDQKLWNTVKAKGWYFELPLHLAKFIWYVSSDANSDKIDTFPEYQLSSYVHNNGVVSWSTNV